MTVTREQLADEYDPDLLFLDGFDDALIGVSSRFGQPTVALYDLDKILESLMAQGMSHEEAEEYFSFNIIGAWVGEMTPAFATIPKP